MQQLQRRSPKPVLPCYCRAAPMSRVLILRLHFLLQVVLDFQNYLTNNDAYNFFKALGDGLIITGATGTNVCDIAMVLVR
eukprot:SAG31_NODE_12093_length_969_cov_1.158621_1_plen_80_part_00